MCFSTEDAEHFENLALDPAELTIVDITGRGSNRPLADEVDDWLASSSSTMLLLGEFGDGKSFFSYLLCRRLAQNFQEDPNHALFPIRISLRELRPAGSGDALIQRWLDSIGASRAEWLQISAQFPTLIILDAFDEMTAKLDPPTVDENLRLLTATLENASGPATSSNRRRKVLVTSRGRFFDQPREEAALRERLGHPAVVRISPLSRTEVLACLSRRAKAVNAEERLAKIRLLYDPIGLAAKPLFLQMIKETLDILPGDGFNATTLYETYIDRSLRRKAGLLVGDQPYELETETVAGMREVLERVAVALHVNRSDRVDLRTLDDSRGGIVDILWKMASEPSSMVDREARTSDARMRISVRSLLRSAPALHEEEWSVNFFHRSMAEYFLAAATTRALLKEDISAVRQILGAGPLSIETIDFVVERVSNSAVRDFVAAQLESVARGAVRSLRSQESLGGNALSLCYQIAGQFHVKNWSGLCLDHVRLKGADLRGFDFSGSSLRFANFDNADLRHTDLRSADLTGLRVEQTTQVSTLAVDYETRTVVAAYSDGAIREWRPSGRGAWVPVTVFSDIDVPVHHLVMLTHTMCAVITATDAWLLARTTPEWTLSAKTPISPFVCDFSEFDSRKLASMLASENGSLRQLDLSAGSCSMQTTTFDRDRKMYDAMAPLMTNSSKTALVRSGWLLSDFFVESYVGPRLWNLRTGQVWNLPNNLTISAFDVVHGATSDDLYVYLGTADGRLFVGRIYEATDHVGVEQFMEDRHGGPITAVRGVDSTLTVTGGRDRCIRLWHSRGRDRTVTALYLTLKCTGALLERIEGPAELALLRALSTVQDDSA
jgi:NACHT domain/Pentapeptide repeats (8 copies)